jgi:hypothetical protein
MRPCSDRGSKHIEGVIVLGSPLNLSRHQRTAPPPRLCSSYRNSKTNTPNPSYRRNQRDSIIGLTNAAGAMVERHSYSVYGTRGIYAASGTVRTTSTYNQRDTYRTVQLYPGRFCEFCFCNTERFH